MRTIISLLLVLVVLTGTVKAQHKSGVLLVQTTDIGDRFEIQGTITGVNESSFTVRGELVAVSSERMDRFKSNRLTEKGNFIKVTGEIKNNILMAENIEVLGKNPEAESNLPQNSIIDTGIFKEIVSTIINIFK